LRGVFLGTGLGGLIGCQDQLKQNGVACAIDRSGGMTGLGGRRDCCQILITNGGLRDRFHSYYEQQIPHPLKKSGFGMTGLGGRRDYCQDQLITATPILLHQDLLLFPA
jgi:hypothetical protein